MALKSARREPWIKSSTAWVARSVIISRHRSRRDNLANLFLSLKCDKTCTARICFLQRSVIGNLHHLVDSKSSLSSDHLSWLLYHMFIFSLRKHILVLSLCKLIVSKGKTIKISSMLMGKSGFRLSSDRHFLVRLRRRKCPFSVARGLKSWKLTSNSFLSSPHIFRLWLYKEQHPEKSQISEQLSKQLALPLSSFYSLW